MQLLIKLSLYLALVPLMSCSAAPNSLQREPSAPLLRFQKTPCLGACPSYVATIGESGNIQFIGHKHVPVQDTVYFQLTAGQLSELRQDAAQLDVAVLQDTYLTQWTDMPATITTFYREGKIEKTVKHQEGGPKTLVDFQEKVHTLLLKLAEEEAKRRLRSK